MAENKETATGGEATFAHRVAEKADKLKYVVLVVLALIVAAAILFSHQKRTNAIRESEAENKVFQTALDLQATPETDALPVFDNLAKEFQGLPAGANALMMKFSYAYNTRNYAAAEEAARELLKTYPKNAMAMRARLALGQSVLMQDRPEEAVVIFRELVNEAGTDIFAEAKLGLAQSLEMAAEKAKDNPEEYRRLLMQAEDEYNDISVRAQLTGSSQRGFWPQAVTLPADFSLVIIRDKLAGHQHLPPGNPASGGPVMTLPPPSAEGDVSPKAGSEASEPDNGETSESGAKPETETAEQD